MTVAFSGSHNDALIAFASKFVQQPHGAIDQTSESAAGARSLRRHGASVSSTAALFYLQAALPAELQLIAHSTRFPMSSSIAHCKYSMLWTAAQVAVPLYFPDACVVFEYEVCHSLLPVSIAA